MVGVTENDIKENETRVEDLEKSIVYKVMVKTKEEEKWQDFTGNFDEKRGWDAKKVILHVKENFNLDQFKPYTFGLFRRNFKLSLKNNNNNFTFSWMGNITVETTK